MTMPPVIAKPAVPQRPEAPRPMFSALAIASSGLSAQRARMEVIAQNLANAETTRTPQGGPYQRQVVSLQATQPQNEGLNAPMGQSVIAGMPAPPVPAVPPPVSAGMRAGQAPTNPPEVIARPAPLR